MSLSIAIVGLPNVGKSTLFNALTKNNVLAANYPFATIEPNVGIVSLPDPRLDQLAKIYGSEKILPAPVTFVDIAGLVAGAAEGQGLGNKFLANIRECSAIVQVVRAFSDPNVVHVHENFDPKGDIETINTELILADLATVEQRLKRLNGEHKSNPKAGEQVKFMERVKAELDAGNLISSKFDEEEREQLSDLQLLTAKPFLFVFNLDEAGLADKPKQAELAALVSPAQAIFLCAKVEAELSELPPEESAELLAELGQDESGLDQLARAGFKTLGLQTYLTAGPKEVRAWTVPIGATAPEAAGVIHTDFQKGFIKAEVVNFGDLMAAGSMAGAKANGKVRLEGKDYVMADGDVVEFRFNV
jgi:GTP-binding protein YchF